MDQEIDKNLRCVTMNYNESNPANSKLFLITDCNENHLGVCISKLVFTILWYNIFMLWVSTQFHGKHELFMHEIRIVILPICSLMKGQDDRSMLFVHRQTLKMLFYTVVQILLVTQ